MINLASHANEVKTISKEYLESIHKDIASYLGKLDPTWIHGLINIEEATSFEFVVLEDL